MNNSNNDPTAAALEVEQQSVTATTTLLDSLESELEQFTSSLVTTNFDDTELFKYFLNEDFVDSSGSEGGFPLSSPLSGSSLGEPNSNDSPQPSPPQLSPDRTDFITSAPLVSVPSVPVFQHSSVKIKEEPVDIRTDGAELKKNGRKRTAPVKEPETPVVALSRDELLKLSGKADNIQGRPEVDEKQQKRQKRLIKNRESAQLSRLRKKIYIEELEKKVTHLSTDNENLTKQVVSLNGDKKRLQDEVVYLQSLIKQSPELSAVLASRKGMQPKNLKAAGVCLLVILFSVGLFFNSNQNPNLPFSRASREEIPEVVPKSTLYTGRVLKSVNEEPTPKIEYPVSKGNTEEYEVVIPAAKEVVLKGRKHDREVDVRFESSLVEKQDKTIPVSRRKRVKISEEESDDNKGLVPLDVAQLKHNTEIVPRRNPNASYIYCPEAHHMAPAVTGDGPELVAILLPASVLNGTLYGDSIPNLSNTLLEVSCQVLNLHMWPMNNTQH